MLFLATFRRAARLARRVDSAFAMQVRTLVVLAPLFVASLAAAQEAPDQEAPPEDAPEAAPYGPVVAQPDVTPIAPVAPAAPAAPAAVQVTVAPVAPPVMAAPIAPPVAACVTRLRTRPSVMANRWAVGLSAGSLTLAPEGSPDDHTSFATGELSVRFRATPHLEFEALAGGGRQRINDMDGDLAIGMFAVSARYHFRPEAPWNWYVMGGVGAAAVTRHDATDEEIDNATQPLGMLGVGVERRFRHLALQAELRGVGLGKREEDRMTAARVAEPIVTPANEARSGGSFTLGGAYYF